MPTEDFVSRHEHEEFVKRMDEANNRLNKRVEILEDNISQIITRQLSSITTTIEKLSLNVENMNKEQESHRKRLEALEGRDGDNWRKFIGYVASAVVGAIICYLFASIGLK